MRNTFRLSESYRERLKYHEGVTLPGGANQGADLSQWCGPVFNQQQEGSCTACTTRDLIWWLENKYGYPVIIDPAVNALYFFGRKIFGDLAEDDGSTLADTTEGAVTYGVIPTSDDQYSEVTLYTQPPLMDVAFKAISRTPLAPTTANIRASLDSGQPVGISVTVMQSLFYPAAGGIVDVGAVVPDEGHAIFVCAYKPDATHGYIYKFQNSWGTDYGVEGFGWFTEAYLGGCLEEVVQMDIPQPVTIIMTVGQKAYSVNGQHGTMDTAPVDQNGRVFVPVMFVDLALGAKTAWIADVKHAVITDVGTTIILVIGSTTYSVNSVNQTMDVAPYIDSDNRTMVPVRFVAEALGCTVAWNQATKTVTITK